MPLSNANFKEKKKEFQAGLSNSKLANATEIRNLYMDDESSSQTMSGP